MKNIPYELTSAARLDLLQIWSYLAETASLDVADALMGDLEAAMLKLARQPGLGHRRRDITMRKLLFYLVQRYFIIYRPKTIPLQVVRVLHASRNIKHLIKA